MERSRTPGPELPVATNFVRPPAAKSQWIGRRVVAKVEMASHSAVIPALAELTITGPAHGRGMWRLETEKCAHCGVALRIAIHVSELPNMVGFLPVVLPAKEVS